MTRFRDDCWLSEVLCKPRNRNRSGYRRALLALNDDMVETKSHDHSTRCCVKLLLPRHRPVRIAAKVLVEVPPVKVNQVVARFDHLMAHRPQGPFRLGP